MTSELQVFNFDGQYEVRVIEQAGEPWFVAKDVCDVLGMADTHTAVRALDDDEKGRQKLPTLGGMQDMTVINESGLYTLIMRSNKPQAKRFRKWVTSEVLPSIRRTGAYSLRREENVPMETLQSAKLILEAAGIKANQLALALDEFYRKHTGESVLGTIGLQLEAPTKHQFLTPTQLGKEYGLSAKAVNRRLEELGYQHKVAGKWEPTELGESFAVMLDTGKQHGGIPIRQMKWESSIARDVFA